MRPILEEFHLAAGGPTTGEMERVGPVTIGVAMNNREKADERPKTLI
jgi:hypothetical protein